MNKIYTVAQVNGYIKRLFVSDYALNHIYMKGEVSNCKYHSSGHIYFTLKDQESAISCVMFAGSRKEGLTFQLADGQSVVAGGNVSVYERDGKYQLYAKEIFLHGAGALYEEYERLKKKLSDEGLFDSDKKKTIPMFPKKVGIVTSKTGAAIRDIESIAKRRNPYVQLVLYPAQVQGVGAGKTIAKGIEQLDKMNMDTIIIGRGGGSIEDLWAFNEEIVARAIYEAKTPIISGVGHETDTTIADYAADLRAATPSAATELAVPNIRELVAEIEGYRYQLKQQMNRILTGYEHQLFQYQKRLHLLNPKNRLKQQNMRLEQLKLQMEHCFSHKQEQCRHQLQMYAEKLQGLSPLAKLTGGYGYVTDKDGNPMLGIAQAQVDENMKILFSDGQVRAKIIDVSKQQIG